MKYDAFTFDTQAVEHNGFNFDGGLLAQIKQFSKGPVQVLITDVVAQEVLRHLQAKTQDAKDAVESAHRKAVLYGLKAESDKAFDAVPLDLKALARTRFLCYLKAIGTTRVPSDTVTVNDVMQLYNKGAPPFTASGKKKHEFPDAIALLALERWAIAGNKHILAVSGDTDWKAFGDESEWIDVVPKLEDALTQLQEDADEAEAIAQQVLLSIKTNSNSQIRNEFEHRLSDAVSSASIIAEGDSAYYFEGEVYEITLSDFDLDDNNGVFDIQIVQSGPSIVAFSVSLRTALTAYASFSLFTEDDDENVGLGTNDALRELEDHEIRVLVTLEGDFKSNEINVSSVELLEGLSEIDFGEIKIDYGETDYELPDDDGLEAGEPLAEGESVGEDDSE